MWPLMLDIRQSSEMGVIYPHEVIRVSRTPKTFACKRGKDSPHRRRFRRPAAAEASFGVFMYGGSQSQRLCGGERLEQAVMVGRFMQQLRESCCSVIVNGPVDAGLQPSRSPPTTKRSIKPG